MNRAQRRAQNKSTPAWRRGETAESMLARFAQNGITAKDYDDAREREYNRGYKEGFAAAAPATYKTIYAAICLAANELHGFGQKRCLDLLLKVDEIVTYSLTSTEAICEVYKKTGLEIAFDEPFDRVRVAK